MNVPQFSVLFSSPYPSPQRLDICDVNPERTALSISTALPFGYNGCHVGYQDAWVAGGKERRVAHLEREAQIVPFGHAVVTAATRPIWNGRAQPEYLGAAVRGATCSGYAKAATTDVVIQSTDAVTPVSVRDVLVRALAFCGPMFNTADISQVADPGLSHTMSEYNLMSPAEIISQISRIGNGQDRYDLTVYDGGRISFQPRTRPTTPDYKIDFEPSLVQWKPNFEELYSTVVLSYTDIVSGQAATPITVPNPTFSKIWGFTRTKKLDGGKLSHTSAYALANTWLNWHSIPIISAQVTRSNHEGLTGPTGTGDVPPWLIRAGQWVQVGDQPSLIIVQSQYDLHKGSFSCDLGEPFPDFDQRIAEFAATSRAVAANRNPISGSFR